MKDMQEMKGCFDCVLAKDGVDRCPVASMCDKPVNPAHGCSWKTPINCKTIRTNGDRIRTMSNKELAKTVLDLAYKFYIETDAGFVKAVMHWLESEVNSDG